MNKKPDLSFDKDQPVAVPPLPPVFKSKGEKVKAILASWGRAGLGAILAVVLVQLQDKGAFPQTWDEAQGMLFAAIVGGLLPMILRYLNPGDAAFGRGAK